MSSSNLFKSLFDRAKEQIAPKTKLPETLHPPMFDDIKEDPGEVKRNTWGIDMMGKAADWEARHPGKKAVPLAFKVPFGKEK